MMKPMTSTPTPLVTREALLAFTQRLVECYAPEKVILYSCGEACGYCHVPPIGFFSLVIYS
jgi:hypothetical protein